MNRRSCATAHRRGTSRSRPSLPTTAIIPLAVLLLTGCAAVQPLLRTPSAPRAEIIAAELTDLSFDSAELSATIEVENPNAFGVTLAAIDYALTIEEAVPLSGRADKNLAIAAEGTSAVVLPVRVSYGELYRSVTALRDKTETTYRLELTPLIEVPVIGPVELPLQASGSIPLLRLPQVAFGGIEVSRLGLTGMELAIAFEVENPNPAAIRFEAVPYALEIAGHRVLSGTLDDGEVIGGSETIQQRLITEVRWIDAGLGVRDLIVAEGRVPYRFDGSLTFATDLPFVGSTTVPFEFSGDSRRPITHSNRD